MRNLQSIIQDSREQAAHAASEGKCPLVIEQEDIADRQVLSDTIRRIPNIGSYVPEGWIETKRFFVDSSGFGDVLELAGHGCLSFDGLLNKIKPGKGYAVVEVGQFQVQVGEFSKVVRQPGEK